MGAVLADLHRLGVKRLRTGVSWAEWCTEGGEAWFDWLIPRLAQEVDVLPCFTYTPPSLGVEPRTSAPPREPKLFADFLDVMITRYGDCFDHVELWNEPNNPAEWDWTLDPDWVQFGRTVGGAAYWAHERGKKVVLGGLSPLDPRWLETMFARGVMDHVDVVGVHGFPGTWEPAWRGWSRQIGSVRDTLARHGSAADVWVTAAGTSTANLDERSQVARFLELLDAPVERAYWYGVRDADPSRGPAPVMRGDERGRAFGMKRADGTPKLLYRLWADDGLEGTRSNAWLTREPRFPRGSDDPVLITGGAGFVGTNLAHRLLSQGRPVLILDNLARPTSIQNLRWLRGKHGERVQVMVADVRNADAVSAAVERASAVFHLAAQVAVTTSLGNPVEDFGVNAQGTLHVLEALRKREDPPPLVFSSTNKVYGRMPDVEVEKRGDRYAPADEDVMRHGVSEARTLDFHSPYGCSKGAADQYALDYARTYDLPATVFRMSCTYGPHQFGTEDQGWVAHFLIRALAGEPVTIYGDGRQVRDVLYVDDLVDAFLAAESRIDALAGRAFNVGGGPTNTLSLRELLDYLADATGKRPPTRFAEWRPGDQPYYVSDVRAIRDAIGWSPRVPVKAGLDRLHAWVRQTVNAPPLALPAGTMARG